MRGIIVEISSKTALDFIMPRHYAGRKPQISIAFGWYEQDDLKAVCTFGKPASPPLCVGVCGEEHSKYVYELNRLCRVDDWTEQLSQFVAYCLRKVSIKNWIVVSFSDTDMGHNGYIYQACNFIYTGVTKERTDKYTEGNKHCRHYDNTNQGIFRKVRSAKHRYIYFATKDKQLKKQWIANLNYKPQDYPKGVNKNYILGEFQSVKLIRVISTILKEV